jgi:hypothetical protein
MVRIRLVSECRGREHNITVPDHSPIKIGTFNHIMNDLADYLEIDKKLLVKDIVLEIK